jgi:NADPH:quinone reductase-like Zn-dependent oxidoreductase
LNDQQAAAVPEAFITANDALMQGELTSRETVLVRGATGSVGSAAVQIAVGLGATVFTPVRTADAEAAMRALGADPLPTDAVCDAVMARTHDRGIDIVLELVGGAGVGEDLDVLGLRGRIVVVSVAAGARVELDIHRLMVRRATIRGTVLRARPLEEKAEAVQAFGERVVPMLSDGRAVASIDSVFPVEEVGRAFDRLVERGKRGKVLLSFT